MKKTFPFFVALLLAGCAERPLTPPEYTTTSAAGVPVSGSTVAESRRSITWRITIGKGLPGDPAHFYMVLTSAGGDARQTALARTFTGSFEIQTATGRVLSAWDLKGGQGTKRLVPRHTIMDACAIAEIFWCVDSKIDDMNIAEYVICAAEAPACYVGLWAVCSWEKCMNNSKPFKA